MERTLNGIAQELDETVDVTARVERGVRRIRLFEALSLHLFQAVLTTVLFLRLF